MRLDIMAVQDTRSAMTNYSLPPPTPCPPPFQQNQGAMHLEELWRLKDCCSSSSLKGPKKARGMLGLLGSSLTARGGSCLDVGSCMDRLETHSL